MRTLEVKNLWWGRAKGSIPTNPKEVPLSYFSQKIQPENLTKLKISDILYIESERKRKFIYIDLGGGSLVFLSAATQR